MAKIAVIGAGIIGAATATWLIGQGHAVTIFEPDPDGLPTSSGNAALIALPEVAPLASPGILMSAPFWLLDPLGPLTLRWADLPALTPWLLAFVASASPSRGAKARQALIGLMRTALADHFALASIAGLSDHLRQTGFLSVYDSEPSITAAVREAELVRSELGFEFERVSPGKARQLVPQLEGRLVAALHQPSYWIAKDPLAILRHFQSFAAAKGQAVTARVVGLDQKSDGIGVRLANGTSELFAKVVVAAGVWSRDLVRATGVKVLLENERGYNTTFTDLGWNLPMPIGFADHGFIATPLINGLRVGGAVELSKPDTPPNFARAKAMRAKMRHYVPALPEGGVEWMGRRPSTPDSLPVISRHPTDPRIVFAFGHGHLGLTLSAVTAQMVADLVADGASSPAVSPFDIKRFQ